MRIIVCIKQVPNVAEVRMDPKTGTLIREGVPSIINPTDKNAIEEALTLVQKHGGEVIVTSMGPLQAEEALREALAMGADEAILLSDRAFAGADTSATSYALGFAINKLGGADLIICGKEALDGMTAQVGPQLAEYLQIPQITYVRKTEIEDDILRVERELENGYELIETRLPALITVTRNINSPRITSIDEILKAYREKEVKVWTAASLGIDTDKIGLKGSPTRIKKASPAEFKKGESQILNGSPAEAARTLVQDLRERRLI